MAFDPVSAALEIGGKIIDRLWPDPAKADAAKLELVKMQQTGELARLASETELAKGQQAINTEEAKSASVFVSGWRPFVGWMCGAAFGYAAIVEPIMRFVASAAGGMQDFPVIDTNLTMQVLFGMLGLGALRTYEKKEGVARS